MSGAAAARVVVEEEEDADDDADDAEAVVMNDAGRVRWRLRDRFTASTLHLHQASHC